MNQFHDKPFKWAAPRRDWEEFCPQPRSLVDDINTALAWGMPDRESTGYSTSALLSLLRQARDRITLLEMKLADKEGRAP